MSYAYIGVVVIAIVLICFVVLSISWVVCSVGKSIRGRTLNIISQYDGLIEEQSMELNRLQELEAQEQQTPIVEREVVPSTKAVASDVAPMFIMNTAERISTTEYRDNTMGQLYSQIRNAFTATPEEIFAQLPDGGAGGAGGPASRLLEQLTFDTVFEMSSLDEQDQLDLLVETMEGDALALLEGYQQSHKHFNSLDFYCYLQDLALLEPRETLIRVPRGVKLNDHPVNSIVLEDDEICEGMEIEVGNTLYDFCIKAREIG